MEVSYLNLRDLGLSSMGARVVRLHMTDASALCSNRVDRNGLCSALYSIGLNVRGGGTLL